MLKARERSGLTQAMVAERLAKPQSYISKSERGERRVDFSEFLELADALSIDASAFIEQYRARAGIRLNRRR